MLDSIVERHEEAALVGTVGVTVLGLAAVVGWFRSCGGRPLARWYSWGVLLAGLILTVYFGWVANLGGQIRHVEIR